MIDTYTFEVGDTPLLISIPHDGRQLPCEIATDMTDAGRAIPDTDWHVSRLYDFARELGASILRAEYSRYVIDLNRPADDSSLYEGRFGSSLCPTQTFAGDDIYAKGVSIDIEARIDEFWRPYHDKLEKTLAELRDIHGIALLWDAHSIPSRVPSLFDGELPELNLGTWDRRSCSQPIAGAVLAAAQAGPYTCVCNGRFKGGHITRHFGRPGENVHAIQLELAQRTYMDEASQKYDSAGALRLRDTLRAMLTVYLAAAAESLGEVR
jgi:N-formylglutamate amidohydrolase